MKRTLRPLILVVLVLVLGLVATASNVGACFTDEGDPVAVPCAQSKPFWELW